VKIPGVPPSRRLAAEGVSENDHTLAEASLLDHVEVQPHTTRKKRSPLPTTAGQAIIWNSSTRPAFCLRGKLRTVNRDVVLRIGLESLHHIGMEFTPILVGYATSTLMKWQSVRNGVHSGDESDEVPCRALQGCWSQPCSLPPAIASQKLSTRDPSLKHGSTFTLRRGEQTRSRFFYSCC
jgi:hypothetical protein